MRLRVLVSIAAALSASCGDTSHGGDGGPGSGTSAACSVPIGTLVQVGGGTFAFTSDSFSCTGTVNGAAEDCGPQGTATVVHEACPDGHAFTVKSGAATLFIRLQGGASASTWSAGAEFQSGLPLTGNITVFGIGPPTQFQPPAGTTEGVSFVLQDTTQGQGIVSHGVLESAW